MPKNLLIVGGVIILILAVLGYFLFGRAANLPGTDTQTFDSIQDAISKNVSLKCEYEDSEGRKTVAYIKGESVRGDVTSSNPDESVSYIFKDNTMYTWNPNTNEGMMMKAPEVKEEDVEAMRETEEFDDPRDDLEQYKESCSPAVVNDSLFTPPANVNFEDFSKMMEDAMMEQGQGTGGVNGESGLPSQEELQKMMEQYGGQ